MSENSFQHGTNSKDEGARPCLFLAYRDLSKVRKVGTSNPAFLRVAFLFEVGPDERREGGTVHVCILKKVGEKEERKKNVFSYK